MTRQTEQAGTRQAGSEIPPVVKELTQAKINAYALAGGDGNPLHTDPEFAAGTQFGGTVAHGMLVLAYLSEMMTAAFGQAWLSGGRLKARFRAPARPGDTVVASGRLLRRDGGRAFCHVECRNQRGEVLITAEAEAPA